MLAAGGEEWAYGCVFCVTGKEMAVARHIERVYCGVRTVAARQVKRRSSRGKTHTEEVILFPGYVFFKARTDEGVVRSFSNENIVSVLTSETGDWRLYGQDEKLVQWLFAYDGLISLSKVYQEGDQIRIIDGPLKDFEGQILRIVKRDRSAQVSISFCNRVVNVWLGFDIVEKYKGTQLNAAQVCK